MSSTYFLTQNAIHPVFNSRALITASDEVRQRKHMRLLEIVITENVDEILGRSAMRLEQERIHVRDLLKGSAQSTAANGLLSPAAFGRLKTYCARIG